MHFGVVVFSRFSAAHAARRHCFAGFSLLASTMTSISRLSRRIRSGVLSAALLAVAPLCVFAQLTTLKHRSGLEGSSQFSAPSFAPDGTIFGTTVSGGQSGGGTLYRLNPDGSGFTVLKHFGYNVPEGAEPYGSVVVGSDGMVYGATYYGNGTYGKIFRVNQDGTGFTILRTMNYSTDGGYIWGGLIEGNDGRLYGTAVTGGAYGSGTVFAVNKDGSSFTVLVHFNGANGGSPYGSLHQGAGSVLYGTTYNGGTSQRGTVFKLNPNGSGFAVLRSLDYTTTGGNPRGGVIQGSDGVLYGAAHYGGNFGYGTIFRMNADGTGAVILRHLNYSSPEGGYPYNVVPIIAGGRLYASAYYTSAGSGTVFSMRASDGADFIIEASFTGTNGTYPLSGVRQGPDGGLYGATYTGGTFGGGTIFRLGAGIGVNFSAGSFAVSSNDQPGIVGGRNWNNIAGGNGSNLVLNDSAGTATTARLTFSAAGAYNGFSTLATSNPATNTMRRGGLYGSNESGEVAVTITNIPFSYYDVYVYASADHANTSTLSLSDGSTTYYYRSNGQSDAGASTQQEVTSTDSATPTIGRAFYQVFRNKSGPSFSVTTGGSIGGVISNNVFGLQIVPKAPPATPPPVINSATTATATYGSAFSYTISATNSPTSYNATGLPAGLSRSGAVISGTPTQTGTFTIGLSATNAAGTGNANLTLTVQKAQATITLANLAHTYDGSAKAASATTAPAGVPVEFSYTGPSLPPTNAGSYGVIAIVNSPNYTGSTNGTLTIAKATATVTLGNLTSSHDGSPKAVSVTTTPANLAVSVTYNGNATAPSNVGNYAVVATVTDPNYAGTAGDTLVIADTTAPVLSLPTNLTVEATGAGGAVASFTASAHDAVSGPVAVTLTPASGTTFALGTTTVTATAADAAGNTATGSFSVKVVDTTAPVITSPAYLTAEAKGAAGALVSFTATATDLVSGAVAVSASPASGNTFALGTTTVTLTATDAAGNTATKSFNVTVQDTTAPVISAPADIVAEATGAAGAAVSFATSASDLVSGAVTVSASPASGSTFAFGTTSVTLTATDAAGNTATKSFNVTVEDTTAPALTIPADQTIEATGPAGAVATYAASATDAVGVASLVYNIASGTTFPIGTTAVSVTAKDAAGNSRTGTFNITVHDTTAPTISSLVASTTTLSPANHKLVAITLHAAASDAVAVTSLKIVSATSNEPDDGLGDGDTAGDIQITGPLTLNLRAERAGTGNGRIYTITVEARDAAGNVTTRPVTVSVPKSQGGK